MFPTRYFADRYFAPRYWPKVGDTVIVNDPITGAVYRLYGLSNIGLALLSLPEDIPLTGNDNISQQLIGK